MVVMEFAKGGKALSFTVMQLGPKVNVSADGSGLVMANARPGATKDQAIGRSRLPKRRRSPSKPSPIPRCRCRSSIR